MAEFKCLPRAGCWVVAVLVGCAALPAQANPTKRTGVIGPVSFKKGSTVTIYIDPDPKSKLKADDPDYRDRVPDAVAGINGWVDPVKNAGNLTLKVVKLNSDGADPATGKPPDLTQPGTVHVTWDPSETIQKKSTDSTQAYTEEALAEGEDDGKGHVVKGELTTGAVIHLQDDATGNPNREKVETKKNAAHEMGHVLGLDHSDEKAKTNVLSPKTETQPDDGLPTAEDLKELANLFASATLPADFDVVVTAEVEPAGAGLFRYRYGAQYLAGPPLGLIQVGLGANVRLSDILPPEGWEWIRKGNVISFDPRFLVDDVPYLDAAYPHVDFSFIANAEPVTQTAWAGSLIELPGPASIAAPRADALAASALLALLLGSTRRRRPATGPLLRAVQGA
ncbi:MAG: matrixin family metalloprotease [Rhodocyclaceae bacterium]|nr:matrixin family metalloprotease [Rhodocyclaceae bacterium]MBX3667317.1 matrixin family metalloprotease [Rhodocyclaceae bacterium]